MALLIFAIVVVVVILFILKIFGLLIGQIILVESIGIAIAAGFLVNHFFSIHPAFCLLIGIAIFFGLFALMNSKIGFWLICGLRSLLWGLLVSVIVFDSTGQDMVWTFVSWGLATLVVFALHYNAKRKME